MSDSRRVIRIFISSPGDVIEERNLARRVIEGLQKRYPNFVLQPVLWEELVLPATASFQESIDFILNLQPIDVAVFIVWCRLGSPLGPAITKSDGTLYRSGTEREFDLMLAAFEQSGKQRPVILAYTRDDDTGFRQKLTQSASSDLEELIVQRKLAESFVREQFHDAEGRNLRAYQTYREPMGFADRLRAHLQNAFDALDDRLGMDTTPRWLEEPYRGLEVFDVRHADIFHGRDEETCDLLQRLRDQSRAGCAFAVIVGASGSGKSSLVRAGVAASLSQHAGSDGVRQWRLAFLVPAVAALVDTTRSGGGPELTKTSLLNRLAETLVDVLPELSSSAISLADITAGLEQDASLTVRLSINSALARLAEKANGEVRLLIVLDQMEELWTDRAVTKEDREQFLTAIEVLARSGHVTVLATLRSDFYSQAQQIPAFLRLKGERGHFDLLPPSAADLLRIITEPARLAGLQFERHKQMDRSLDDVVLEDAARDPAALPLLQYALSQLYEHRDESRRLLTFAAYQELGGVEGALSKRAEEVFQELSDDAQAALDELLPLLISVDVIGEQSAVRRRMRLPERIDQPTPRQELINSLTAARLLTTDRQGDVSVATLAHEALLRRWERIALWIATNREHLRLRVIVEQSQQRWERQNRDDSLLLPTGLPLEEGRQLLAAAPHLLTSDTSEYLRRSIDHHEQQTAKTRRRRQVVLTVLSALTLLAMLGGGFAWFKQQEAQNQRVNVEAANREIRKQKKELAKKNDDAKAMLAEAAARYCSIARILVSQGRHDDALANLARACEYAPDSTLAAEQAIVSLSHVGLCVARFEFPPARCASFDPDGTRIAIAATDVKSAHVFDAATGKEITCLTGHKDGLYSAEFSPDGSRIVTASEDKTARLWDAATGKELAQLIGHTDDVKCATFSSDGFRIVTASKDKTARLWDTATGKELAQLIGHTDDVECARFSPDGSRIVTASKDTTARVWDVVTAKEITCLARHENGLQSANFSSDGSRIVTASEDSTRVWDVATGKERAQLAGCFSITDDSPLSPDGTRIATSSWEDMTPRVWDPNTGKESAQLSGHAEGVGCTTFSSDGSRIVTTSFDKTARVWDAATGKEVLQLIGHTDSVLVARFSPNGSRIITTSMDGTVCIWDAANAGELMFQKLFDASWRTRSIDENAIERVRNLLGNTSRISPWFPRFLRLLAAHTLNEDGETTALTLQDLQAYHTELQEALKGDRTGYGAIARFYLTPSPDRPMLFAPQFTSGQAADFAIRTKAKHDAPSPDPQKGLLEWAYNIHPVHPLIHIALAKYEENATRANFLRDYDTSRLCKRKPNKKDSAQQLASYCLRGAELLLNQHDNRRAELLLERAEELAPNDANLPTLRSRLHDSQSSSADAQSASDIR